MSERWLTVVLEREPEPPGIPHPSRVVPGPVRRPLPTLIPVPPPKRRPIWSWLAGVLLVSGVLAVLIGASSVAASDSRWNQITADTAEAGEGIAGRSQAAGGALTDDLAGLESATATLGAVSSALDAAAGAAAELEAVASGALPPGRAAVEILVDEIGRLADAIDGAFPGLAALGISVPDGPGGALRAAGAALLAVVDASLVKSVTGFGPFVLQYPVPGYPISAPFGTDRGDGFHGGVDIGASAGTPILAAADGVVLQAGWLDDAAGNGVILGHDHDWETRYFHMMSADLPVRVGDRVLAGQVIGSVGSTGESTGPHLHFETVFGPIRLDPASWFTYTGREIGSANPPSGREAANLPEPVAEADERTGRSTAEGPAPGIGTLPEAITGITEVQRDLGQLGADAAERAAEIEERRGDEQGRVRTAVLTLYGGAGLVVLGLLLLWATRPRWPAARQPRTCP